MNIVQIIVKTVVTTVDLLIAYAVLNGKEATDGMKKAFIVFALLNLTGVWL